MALVLVYRGDKSAQENIERLRKRLQEVRRSFITAETWTDRVECMEVSTQGRMLPGKLGGERASPASG